MTFISLCFLTVVKMRAAAFHSYCSASPTTMDHGLKLWATMHPSPVKWLLLHICHSNGTSSYYTCYHSKQLVNCLHSAKQMVWHCDKETTSDCDTRGLQVELPCLPSHGRSGENMYEEEHFENFMPIPCIGKKKNI